VGVGVGLGVRVGLGVAVGVGVDDGVGVGVEPLRGQVMPSISGCAVVLEHGANPPKTFCVACSFHSALAIFHETRDQRERLPDKVFIARGIGRWRISCCLLPHQTSPNFHAVPVHPCLVCKGSIPKRPKSSDILMAESFLDGTNIISGFKHMRRKRMSEAVAARRLGDRRLPYGLFHGTL